MKRRVISLVEFEAACRAYWEHENVDDGPWDSLPLEGKRNVRRRIRAVLAAIGTHAPDDE